MKVVIIEDEMSAARRLAKLLHEVEPQAEVLASLDSIEESVQWLIANATPELIFSDIQLADGLSFEIYRKVQPNCPIIFTTAFDEYAIEAFKLNSIDYLLKPIDKADLKRALDKFKRLNNATNDIAGLLKQLAKPDYYKTRFLFKSGTRLVPCNIDQVAYFYAEDKLVYVQLFDGKKYIWDESLDKLEQQLDPTLMFRAGRQLLISRNAIESIHNYFNGKLKLTLKPAISMEVTVSREKAGDFKNWLN
jgi:two-component system LytT family response regulator